MPYSRANMTGSNNVILTEAARLMQPTGFIADLVFPPLERDGMENFQLLVWDDSNCTYRSGQSYRAYGNESNRVHSQIPGYKSGTTAPHHLNDVVLAHDKKVFAANGGDPAMLERRAVGKLVDKLNIEKEIIASTKACTTSNYSANVTMYTTISSADCWNTAGGGDPMGVIAAGKAAFRNVVPNYLAIDIDTFNYLSVNPALQNLLKYTSGQAIGLPQMEALFGLKILVSAAKYKSLDTLTWATCWGDNALIFYRPENIGPVDEDMTYGRMVYSRKRTVTQWDEPSLDPDGATVIELGEDYVPMAVGIDNSSDADFLAGYLITNTIA